MRITDSEGWQRTTPVAILFFIGKILRILAKNAWQSIAPLFVYISVGKEDLVTKLIIGGVALAVVIVVGSVLSWLFFRYRISDDSILIRSGVIRKKQLDIKFDRIQGINTRQNPVYRAMGLVTVAFDTAGSSGSEGNLPAVNRDFADALRKRISRKKDAEQIDENDDTEAHQPLLQLGWRDMIRIGLADRRALIVFALIGPLMEQMGDQIESYIERFLQTMALEAAQLGVGTGVLIVVGLVIGTVLLLALVSITAAFLQYHDFELYLDDRTLRSHGGLLTRHEHSMDLEKIQTLRLQQGIVQAWLKRFRMTARQATASGRQRSQKMFVIPVLTAAEADGIRPNLLGPEAGRLSQDPRSTQFRPISRYYMRSRLLYGGLVPALLLGIVASNVAGAYGLAALLWVPVMAGFSWRNWKRAGYCHDDNELVRRSGLLGFRTASLQFRKVQRVTVSQSHYQRRKGLASLRLYMASGSVRVPYIDYATAARLRDYILYKVESSQRAWH